MFDYLRLMGQNCEMNVYRRKRGQGYVLINLLTLRLKATYPVSGSKHERFWIAKPVRKS